MTKEEKKQFRKLEKAIGYSFRKPAVLKRALTHKSYANERKLSAEEHNERLEFLGDAVLELAVSELLMKRYPDFSEGELSKMRAAIVNEKQLAALARSFRLGDFLYLGRGEEQTSGREKSSLLADAYEAVLGGIYLDRGFKKASRVIEEHYARLLEETPPHAFYQDYKTELQERCQSLFRAIPRYRLIAERGPDHDKVFDVEIYIRNEMMGQGTGRSKKEAEQEAAKEALERLSEVRV
jgi:ribonuclease III